MATKDRIKRIEKKSRVGDKGVFLVRQVGRGYWDMDGQRITKTDLADIQAAGGLTIVWDSELDGI